MDNQLVVVQQPLRELRRGHRPGQRLQLCDNLLREFMRVTWPGRLWKQACNSSVFPGGLGRVKGDPIFAPIVAVVEDLELLPVQGMEGMGNGEYSFR